MKGAAARGSIVSWNALAALGELLSNSSRRVLRLRADGRSHLLKQPEWLAPATQLDLYLSSENGRGSSNTANHPTRLFVEAPSLFKAAPEAFAQLKLWQGNLNPQDTAVSLWEESLRDAVNGKTQSDLIDRGILGSIANFAGVLDMGFDSISLNGGNAPSVEINRSALEIVEKLVVKAPEPRKVIVSGTLDMLQNSRRSFILQLKNKRKIRGFYPQSEAAYIASNYAQTVVIDGEAVFRPSGDIASIVASKIRLAEAGDEIWSRVPIGAPRTLDDLHPKVPVAAGGNAFARIFGAWPGEESDEQIEEMLANLG